jgi:hypothetical protein
VFAVTVSAGAAGTLNGSTLSSAAAIALTLLIFRLSGAWYRANFADDPQLQDNVSHSIAGPQSWRVPSGDVRGSDAPGRRL